MKIQIYFFQFFQKSVLIALLLCLLLSLSYAQSDKMITSAAVTFVEALTPEQYKQTVYSFEDSLREKWTNLPVGMVPRPGIRYGDLGDSSRLAFQRLLTIALSSQGYLKINSIMHLDDILNVLYKDAFERGEVPERAYNFIKGLQWAYNNYYIAIWGNPKEKAPWGISFGGHHIAFSLTVAGASISMSPLFLGTDPAEIKNGKYTGWRILSKEEDLGFMLLHALSDDQQAKTILNEDVPRDIITNPNSSQRITSYYGISVSEFDDKQKAILELLIQEYTHNYEHETAHRLHQKILATGLDKIYFAWIGSKERDKPHYYIINGPDFLIEYDNYPNSGNHIHLILREKGEDFGEDLLKAHYEKSGHH